MESKRRSVRKSEMEERETLERERRMKEQDVERIAKEQELEKKENKRRKRNPLEKESLNSKS